MFGISWKPLKEGTNNPLRHPAGIKKVSKLCHAVGCSRFPVITADIKLFCIQFPKLSPLRYYHTANATEEILATFYQMGSKLESDPANF